MGSRSLFSRTSLAGLRFARSEPWTIEGKLHLALAAVAILGWTVAYTVLTHGIDASQDIARGKSAGTQVSVNLPAR